MTTDDLANALRMPYEGCWVITCASGARLTLEWGELLRANRRTALGAMRAGQRPGWYEIEVRCHNRAPRALRDYERTDARQFHGWVPVEVVEQIIHAYGGIKRCTTKN